MTADLHNGYYRQFFANGRYAGVAPAGDAWLNAIATNVATRNPDSPDPTKLNFCYFNACILFYRTTGVDLRTLGASEQAAAALGIALAAAVALHQVTDNQVNMMELYTLRLWAGEHLVTKQLVIANP